MRPWDIGKKEKPSKFSWDMELLKPGQGLLYKCQSGHTHVPLSHGNQWFPGAGGERVHCFPLRSPLSLLVCPGLRPDCQNLSLPAPGLLLPRFPDY